MSCLLRFFTLFWFKLLLGDQYFHIKLSAKNIKHQIRSFASQCCLYLRVTAPQKSPMKGGGI